MKARLIAAGLLGLWIGSTGIAGDIRAEHHIFLVDISGSMLKAKGATPSPIHVRQEVLRNWFKTNPSSSVTLISFNTDISSPQTFKLANANELAKALRWINELESNKRRGTHLWTCLSKTLHVSTDWIKQHPEDSVVLHVLTDRLDTERTISFGDAIKDFAEVTPRELLANGGGDFELRIVKKSEETTTNGGPRPKESTPTPTATATATPTPTPTPTSTSTPTPTAEAATFEIQEPRIVSSGQFVHFINKTSPPADSYFWTIRENPRRCDRVKSGDATQPADSEVELPAEHLVYQFCNDGTQPRSYTVFLTATRGAKASVSPPVSILVQASPGKWTAMTSRINWNQLWTHAGAFFSGLISLLSVIATIINGKKSHDAQKIGGSREVIRRSRNRALIFFGLFIVFLILCGWLTHKATVVAAEADQVAEQKAAENAKPPPTSAMAPSVPQSPLSGSTPPPAPPVIINVPSNQPAGGVAPPLAPPQNPISTISIILVTLLATLALAAAAEFIRRQAKDWPTSYSSWGSLIEQLSELDRLREGKIIPEDELETFREAILRELRKRYGVPSNTNVTPASSIPPSKM